MTKNFILTAVLALAGPGFASAQVPVPDPVPLLPNPTETAPENPLPSSPSDNPIDGSIFGPPSGTPLRYWARAEYLLWWTRGDSTPPLVTSGPPLPSPGFIGAAGTAELFGGNDGNNDPFSGGRFTLGFWCNDCQTIGAEINFFFLGPRANGFDAATSGAPGSAVLARPFFDTSNGMEDSELVGFPGLGGGRIHVQSSSELFGGDSNLLFNLCRSCDIPCDPCDRPALRYRVDALAGFRFMELREGLRIDEDTQVDPTSPVFAGDNISAFDQFQTLNQFYGLQLGIRSEWSWGRLFADVNGTVALGDTHQIVDINGATRITTPGGVTTVLPGNLLTQSSNIGHYTRDVFTVVPEIGVNFGYQLTRNLSVFAGYTFIYWSDVERPGDAISLRINSTRVPTSTVAPSGPLDPLFSFHGSSFWAQGANFGFQLRF